MGTKTRSAGRVLVRETPHDVEDHFVDIVVKGRNTEVTERFRQHATEKLARIERFDAKVISIDVECSQERNPRLSDQREVIELTIRSRGPVVRAEAAAQDCYAALDLAVTKLESRLRRARDRRKVHHGAKTPVSVAVATAGLDSVNGAGPSSSASTRSGSRPFGEASRPAVATATDTGVFAPWCTLRRSRARRSRFSSLATARSSAT